MERPAGRLRAGSAGAGKLWLHGALQGSRGIQCGMELGLDEEEVKENPSFQLQQLSRKR